MGKIFWIASYPKSGNTWMRFLLYAYFTLERRDIARIDVNDPGFQSMFTQDSDRVWFEHRFETPWDKISEREFAAARAAAQEEIAGRGEGLVLAKTHAALVNVYGHPTINSAATAGAVYIVRNPLDLAAAIRNHYHLRTLAHAVRFLNNPVQVAARTDGTASTPICSWRRNVDSWTAEERTGIHVVRYEDLLAEPLDAFDSVIRRLGQPLDAARLERAVELVSFDRLRDSEAQSGFLEKPERAEMFFRSGKAGGWRETLSRWQVAEIVKANRPTMERFGYWPPPPGP